MSFVLSALKILSEKNNGSDSNAQKVPESPSDASLSKATAIFLRIRASGSQVQNENHDDIYSVEDPSTLIVKINNPTDSTRRSKPSNVIKKFIFSKIFNSDDSQSQFFEQSIRPGVINFLNGKSSTVISYGTADSGKTYSLYGTASEPGIIPRSIAFIYSALACTLIPWYKPKQFGSILQLDETDRYKEICIKEKFLSSKSYDKSTSEETYKELENLKVHKDQDCTFRESLYSVWISFIEIYNDIIYDLLDIDDVGKKTQLKLSADKSGSTYVQGMRSVCAITGLEAYKILCVGQARLSTVATTNYKSSRSHSIFIVKLLEYEKSSAPAEVKISSLSFYDLAGPGRIQKTIADEKQLRESCSINTSLLALGRCFKIISEDHSRQSIGSFRESKLTRILQHSFRNKENIFLLINLNPAVELLPETQSILNFASTAVKLTPEFTKEDKRFSNIHTQINSPTIRESDLSENLKIAQEQEINDVILKNQHLLGQITELKSSKLKREYEIRQELTDFYSKEINKLEENWKNKMSALEEEKDALLEFSVKQVKNFYLEKLEGQCGTQKRKKIDIQDNEDIFEGNISNKSNSEYFSEVLTLKESLESIKTENKQLNIQKNSCAFELSLMNEHLKKFNELTAEQSETSKNDTQNVISKPDTEMTINDEASDHLLSIQEFVGKSLKVENDIKLQETEFVSKNIQYSYTCSIVSDFLSEIQGALDFNSISLPELDDSSNDSDTNCLELKSTLNKIKELIFDNRSKTIKYERENTDMLEEIENLNDKLRHQEQQLLQTKLQYQESESVRESLFKTVEYLKVKLNSEKFFKNSNFNTVLDNLAIYEDDHMHAIDRSLTDSSANESSRISLFDLSFEKVEGVPTRSSSDNSKNDSGLAFSIESACKLTEEKSCQTISSFKMNQEYAVDFSFRERLTQLKLDYKQMKSQHIQESLKVTELSQELDHVKETMTRLKENASVKEKIVKNYESELYTSKLEVERLNSEKRQLELNYDEVVNNLLEVKKEHEMKLTESQAKSKIYEEDKSMTAKCLENYWEKSVNLGSELSIAYGELEKTSIRCYTEHVLKISHLEKQLHEKKLQAMKLEEQVMEYEKDRAGLSELSIKVIRLEDSFEKIKHEKADLQKLLDEKLKLQSKVEEQMQRLIARVEERDSVISLLKSDFDTISQTNLLNCKKAKELGKEVTNMMEKICVMKKDVLESEASRKELESNTNKEINTLKVRLDIFKENAELLNVIFDNNESKQSEVSRLKSKLLKKQKELDFFKENRNATIQRYENLVRRLQEALTMNTQCKVKKKYPQKQKYFIGDLLKSSGCNVLESEVKNRSQAVYFYSDEIFEPVRNEEKPTSLVTNFNEKC